MKIVSLQAAGVQNNVPVFGVQIAADDGKNFTFWADGQSLHNPVGFATQSTERTGSECTSEFVGDEGGWHAHLADMLRRSGGPAPAQSNGTAAATPATFAVAADRRAALLGATALGQSMLAAEAAAAAAVPPPVPDVPPITFSEQCRLDTDAADRARRAGLAKFLKLTTLGRNVLAADARPT